MTTPVERAAHRLPGSRAFDDADDLAHAHRCTLFDAERPEHADAGRDDHAFDHRHSLAFEVESGAHADLLVTLGGIGRTRCSHSAGVPHARTGTSGTVRLATPAIIEPWPTSTNAVAPSPASVSIDVRQRTGTVTWSARRVAPTVGVVGRRPAVVVRHDRRAGRRERDVCEGLDEAVARASS